MTVREYLELEQKTPWYNEYEGNEKDKELIRQYNRDLITRYPWLLPHNRWTDKVAEDYDYNYTELDSMPTGWRIGFAEPMCEELNQALLKAQEANPGGGYAEAWITTNYDSDKIIPYVEGFRIVEIKEKYGTLRFYHGGAPREVQDVIDKYEDISGFTCLCCGEQARWISTGWISPYCDQCAKDILDRDNNYLKEYYPSQTPTKFKDRYIDIKEYYKQV